MKLHGNSVLCRMAKLRLSGARLTTRVPYVMTPGTVQAELDRMAQTGRVRLSPALANLTPAGHMTARCLEGGRMQLNFDSPMRSPPRSMSAHPSSPGTY